MADINEDSVSINGETLNSFLKILHIPNFDIQRKLFDAY